MILVNWLLTALAAVVVSYAGAPTWAAVAFGFIFALLFGCAVNLGKIASLYVEAYKQAETDG